MPTVNIPLRVVYSKQDIRDAGKLAPSAGDAEVGSIDNKLNAVGAIITSETYGLSVLKTILDGVKVKVDDVHDETFGKWSIDLDAGTLTLYRVNGEILIVFDLTSAESSVPAYVQRAPRE